MTETVRLFVAVDPAGPAVAHLARLVGELEVSRANTPGHSTRLAAPASWHLTLAFIGEVETVKVEAASAALSRAASGIAEPIMVRFGGGGRFGRGRFTILWAGVAGDRAGLAALAESTRRELRRGRVPFDRKPFRPHLTLARPGDRLTAAQLTSDLEVLAGYEGPEWSVDAVHLYSSKLGPRPVHTRLTSVALPPAR